jgi:hypothetical protein
MAICKWKTVIDWQFWQSRREVEHGALEDLRINAADADSLDLDDGMARPQ